MKNKEKLEIDNLECDKEEFDEIIKIASLRGDDNE